MNVSTRKSMQLVYVKKLQDDVAKGLCNSEQICVKVQSFNVKITCLLTRNKTYFIKHCNIKTKELGRKIL